jgi:hypothetical protein
MRRLLPAFFYVMVVLVVISELRTVWLALAERQRFLAYLPGVKGAFYSVFIATSAAAGLNALLVAARFRWAVWLNIGIGAWSILLLQLVHAPAVNSLVVAIACLVIAGVPLVTWMRGPLSPVGGR